MSSRGGCHSFVPFSRRFIFRDQGLCLHGNTRRRSLWMTYEFETLKWCFSSDTGSNQASCMNLVSVLIHQVRVRDAHVLLNIGLARLNSALAKLHTQLRGCAIDPPCGKVRNMLLITLLGLVHRWWLAILVLLWLSGRVHRGVLVRISLEGWLL
jgi:hypothetical protein